MLVADDEAHLGRMLGQVLAPREFVVQGVPDHRAAREALSQDAFDVAVLAFDRDGRGGLELLEHLRGRPLPPEVLVMAGSTPGEATRQAIERGAYACLTAPYRVAEIEALIRRAWERRMLARDNRTLRSQLERLEPDGGFITQYAPLKAVLAMVAKFAASPLPVFVTGERGTGKALLAHLLHRQGPRSSGPFVHVNCVASDPASHTGACVRAAGGTLLLDRFEALAPDAREMLLDALETGTVRQPGGTEAVPFDTRVVATSAEAPLALVSAGFSELLMHRLSAIRVALPALRERAVDVPLLARTFLRQQDGALRLSDRAMDALERYAWPGNVRELQLVIARAALLAEHGVVEPGHLALPDVAWAGSGSAAAGARTGDDRGATHEGRLSLSELERRHIARVLEGTAWHQGRAAEVLGISPKTLYRKIRDYGFTRPSGRTS